MTSKATPQAQAQAQGWHFHLTPAGDEDMPHGQVAYTSPDARMRVSVIGANDEGMALLESAVRAVNAHDDLVAALEAARDEFERLLDVVGEADGESIRDHIERIDDALLRSAR